MLAPEHALRHMRMHNHTHTTPEQHREYAHSSAQRHGAAAQVQRKGRASPVGHQAAWACAALPVHHQADEVMEAKTAPYSLAIQTLTHMHTCTHTTTTHTRAHMHKQNTQHIIAQTGRLQLLRNTAAASKQN